MKRSASHAAWGALFAVGCIVGGAHIDPSLDDDGSGGSPRGGSAQGDDDDGGGKGGTGTASGGAISVGGTSKGGSPTGGTVSTGGRGGTRGGGSGESGEAGEPSGGTGGDGGAAPGGSGMGGFAGIGGMGGTAGTAGTSGSAGKGGTAGTAGTAGSAGKGGSGGNGGSAGTGGSGGTAGVNTDSECVGIKSNFACLMEGKQCPNLSCGLGDVGRRQCNCATNWTCTSCNWAGTVLETKPPNAETPCTGAGEGMPCANWPGMAESVCKSTMVTTEYCMCAINPRAPADPPEWDCDSPPSSW